MPKVKKTRVHCQKVIHPNSRKATKLTRKAHRADKLLRKKAERNYLLQVRVGEKFRWFYENLEDGKEQYSCSEVCHLIERYLHRFDIELKKINEQNSMNGRHGRSHASREDALTTIIERETEMYDTCGIELPDLTSAKTLAQFKEWNCDVAGLELINMRKFHSSLKDKNHEKMNSDVEKGDSINFDKEKA